MVRWSALDCSRRLRAFREARVGIVTQDNKKRTTAATSSVAITSAVESRVALVNKSLLA